MGVSPRPIHLLHVDDDPALAELVAEFINRIDDRISVDSATSASEGLELLEEKDFDCVASDYDMPGQNGIEFLKTIRDDDANLPFILFTGKGSEEVASEAISAEATDYLQKGRGTEQYDLLTNRIRNSVEQYRATQRVDKIGRLRAIATHVNQALVRSKSRGEMESRICEIFSDADPYLFAWIGECVDDTRTVRARSWAGVEQGYLDAIEITTDDTPTGRGPTARAINTRDVVVLQDIAENPEFEPWRDEAIERGFRSSAALPLVYDETLYGVLNLYANGPEAFDEREHALLAELSDDIAHALYSFDVQSDLREERVFIGEALDSLDDVFYVIGPEGDLRRWNERIPEVTGHSADALDDMGVIDLFPHDQREQIADAIEQTLTTGNVIVKAELLATDGSRIPYEFTGSRLTDSDGNLLGLIGIGRAITGRARDTIETNSSSNRV